MHINTARKIRNYIEETRARLLEIESMMQAECPATYEELKKVMLVSYPEKNKIQVIKCLRELRSWMSLRECHSLVNEVLSSDSDPLYGTPQFIGTHDLDHTLCHALRGLGCELELK